MQVHTIPTSHHYCVKPYPPLPLNCICVSPPTRTHTLGMLKFLSRVGLMQAEAPIWIDWKRNQHMYVTTHTHTPLTIISRTHTSVLLPLHLRMRQRQHRLSHRPRLTRTYPLVAQQKMPMVKYASVVPQRI